MDRTPTETFEALAHEIITVCGHLHGGEYCLIDGARHTTAGHLAKWVRAARQAERLSDPGGALDANKYRHLDYHFAPDGSVVFEGRLPAEQGALLLQALERARDWLFAEEAPDLRKRINGPVPDEGVPDKAPSTVSRADATALLGERSSYRQEQAHGSTLPAWQARGYRQGLALPP